MLSLRIFEKIGIDNFSNHNLLYLGDTRKLIFENVDDNSVDLIITSPPYLNSRDYTDSYMLELKALDFLTNYNDIKKLREQTIRSHVQLKIQNLKGIQSKILKATISEMESLSKDSVVWNTEIQNMIIAYFEDMEIIFNGMYQKLKKGRRNLILMFSNSCIYFGVG